MAFVTITNLRGPAARIIEATAETVLAGVPAAVEMTGPDQGRAFHFKIPTGPQGLPGVNAVANDSATATYIATPASSTNTAAKTLIDAQVDTRVIIRYAAGQPNRPNIILGGLQNGSDVHPTSINQVLLQPGSPGYNNIIGGDGSATVNTATPNVVDPTIPNVGVSLIGGYDNVIGSISGKIIADHTYTAKGSAGHNGAFGGTGHILGPLSGHSMVAGGENNKVNGPFSFATGNRNVNDGTSSFVAGAFNTLTGPSTGSTIVGQLNEVATSYARVTGYGNKVDSLALFGDVSGAYGKARSPFVQIRAGGRIAVDGDAQTVLAHYRGQSTSATAVLLIAAYTGTGSNSQYTMLQGQTAFISAEVIAREVGAATVGVWKLEGTVAWATGGAAPAWVTGPTVTPVGTPVVGTTATILPGAGGSAGRIFIQCTGLAAKTINWSCNFKSVEVIA